MSRFHVFAVVMSAVMISGISVAAAGDKQDWGKDGGKSGKEGVAQRAVSLDEFKARCERPQDFDIQRAPQNIRIQCTDDHLEYVAGTPGIVPLAGARQVQTAVLSDKFVIAGLDAKDIPVYAQSGTCLRFKEIRKGLTIEKTLSCGEIAGIKGSLEDYCVSALDASKAGNPKMISVQDTGRLVDTCAGVQGAGDWGKGGGKDGGKDAK